MSEPEIMLWSRLKTRGAGKPIFRRQYVYESMIFDFYCPAARLAVEVDGSAHWTDEKQARDDARDTWLAVVALPFFVLPQERYTATSPPPRTL